MLDILPPLFIFLAIFDYFSDLSSPNYYFYNQLLLQPEKKDMVGMQEQVCTLIVLCFGCVLCYLTFLLVFRSLCGKSSSCMTNMLLM